MGKSALLAAWLARREARGDAVPHHFIRRGEYDWDDPAKLVGSLVAQIEARFPRQHEAEDGARMHPAARLDAMLRRVSQHELAPRGEQLVILIDGLDEYDPPTGSAAVDPLAAFLPHALPPGVRVLCASRPRRPYVDMLEARGALPLDLDAAHFGADNEATVRAFWEQAAPALGLDAKFIVAAAERADGNLQHAAMLRRHLDVVAPGQRRVEDIPRGLAALLAKAWERIAADPTVVEGLGILCAAREALTLDELGAVSGWADEAQRRRFLRGARELLVETQRAEGVAEYRLHHDSIRGHVAGAIGDTALRRHHRRLGEALANWPVPAEATTRRYALRHALSHRAEVGEWADAWRVASDLKFLEAKYRELGAADAEIDVVRIAERCRAIREESHRGHFEALARALGRESHWLRVAPEATAALVWNELRRAGWSADELARNLQVPANARFLRLRHVASRESPALERTLMGHAGWVNACAVTVDGRRVVSASVDKTLKAWDLATGHEVATLDGHTSGVTACAVTPDGHVVSASGDKTLKVWDIATGHAVATLHGHDAAVTDCAVTPNGRRVVSASRDKTLKVWDLETGLPLATLEGHADLVNACAVTPDGRRVVSASSDKTLKVWDLETGLPLATLEGHADLVNACAVISDGWRVVSASDDKTLKVWDLRTGRELVTLHGHAAGVTDCAVTSDGWRVVSASTDRTLRVWDPTTGHEVATLRGHAAFLTSCAVTPDGRRVVSASGDQMLNIWDLAIGHEVAALRGHATAAVACAVTPDERRVVSASDDNTLKMWDLATGHEVATLRGHADGVTACAVTPNGQRVVSASVDRTLKVWDLATKHDVATLRGHASFVTACTVTPNGQRVVSASQDKTLKVWDLGDLETGRPLATLEGHADLVNACAVTPDGRHVVSASWDKTLKVWDLETGRPLATLEGHADLVNACAVTPDGRRVVSASRDRTLRVWDPTTGHEVATLRGHAASVTACAVTPDGRRVVSASRDKTLKVWDLESGALLLTHCTHVEYRAIAVTAATIIAGDVAGSIWFLDRPAVSFP
jgi:WD40 repeat protein